jgi:O-antigen/teichoic acid export membrane protein
VIGDVDPGVSSAPPRRAGRAIWIRAAAEAIALASAALVAIWINRVVGPVHAGNYAVAQVVYLLGGIVVTAGLTTAGSQLVANDAEEAASTWWTVTLARVAIALGVVAVAQAARLALPIEAELDGFLAIVLVTMLVVPFRSEWLLVARGATEAAALTRVVAFGSQALLAVGLIRSVEDVPRLPFVIAGSAVAAAATSVLLSRRIVLPARREMMTRDRLEALLRDARHYFAADLSIYVYTSSDRLFLYALASPLVVGLYDAAYKLIQPFYSISAAVGDAMYLRLAVAHRKGPLAPEFRRYVDLMCIGTIPLGFFLALHAPWAIALAYGNDYAAAAPYLAVLGFVITFGYMSGVTVLPFAAWNRPSDYSRAILIGNAANVILNLVLIPPMGGMGAAVATVAAKIAVTVSGLRSFYRLVRYPLIDDFFVYSALSIVAFGVSWAMLALGAPTLASVIGFAATYLLAVALVRWRVGWRISNHLRGAA